MVVTPLCKAHITISLVPTRRTLCESAPTGDGPVTGWSCYRAALSHSLEYVLIQKRGHASLCKGVRSITLPNNSSTLTPLSCDTLWNIHPSPFHNRFVLTFLPRSTSSCRIRSKPLHSATSTVLCLTVEDFLFYFILNRNSAIE